MIFNSLTFLIFFVLFFILYWFINNKLNVTYRNIFIVISSYIFYGWWDWRFLSLIFISSAADYSIGILLGKFANVNSRKRILIFSILINLGILGFFKYFNFFMDSFFTLLSVFSLKPHYNVLQIVLPVGISFYTFQTLSYTIDVYRRKLEPNRDIFSFLAFVSFFPQLVAGPIERATHLLPQFFNKKTFSYESCKDGLRLILWGLVKKVVFADNFGVLTDRIFDISSQINGLSTLCGALFFGFQIYFDFSGYSDIAIGTSKMLGFELMANFRTPYFSSSIREFWQRWHISLSTWFRDYLYIPLGGNRASNLKVNFNILITFLISGLWHGAQVTFLVWGGLHGLVLVIEKKLKIKVAKFIAIPVTFILVTLFWIPFRAENFSHFINMTNSLTQFNSYSPAFISSVISDFSVRKFSILICVLLFFLFIENQLNQFNFSEWVKIKVKPARYLYYYLLILIFLMLGNFDVKPYFIYFQF